MSYFGQYLGNYVGNWWGPVGQPPEEIWYVDTEFTFQRTFASTLIWLFGGLSRTANFRYSLSDAGRFRREEIDEGIFVFSSHQDAEFRSSIAQMGMFTTWAFADSYLPVVYGGDYYFAAPQGIEVNVVNSYAKGVLIARNVTTEEFKHG